MDVKVSVSTAFCVFLFTVMGKCAYLFLSCDLILYVNTVGKFVVVFKVETY
jgi:hypothetical protein